MEEISRYYSSRISLKLWGGISLTIVSVIVGISVYITVSLPVVGILFKIYFAYAGLSLGGLLQRGKEILNPVKEGDILTAKKRLQYIVSRDTEKMNEHNVLTSVAETLAENFNDGFIAPLFYLFLGGPTLMWIYKTVNTMDSMWGYKTEKWIDLGWAGAKMDDILGFIPARLSFFIIFFTSLLYFRSLKPLSHIKRASRDARGMESPNAGWPMAAIAWCFYSSMGGRWTYFGVEKQKPYLGPKNPLNPWNVEKIESLLTFLLLCGIETILLVLLTNLIF